MLGPFVFGGSTSSLTPTYIGGKHPSNLIQRLVCQHFFDSSILLPHPLLIRSLLVVSAFRMTVSSPFCERIAFKKKRFSTVAGRTYRAYAYICETHVFAHITCGHICTYMHTYLEGEPHKLSKQKRRERGKRKINIILVYILYNIHSLLLPLTA